MRALAIHGGAGVLGIVLHVRLLLCAASLSLSLSFHVFSDSASLGDVEPFREALEVSAFADR